jgi:flagellar assembly protein FliH
MGTVSDGVLRGDSAGTVSAARFTTDLRTRPGAVTELAAQVRTEAQAAGYAAGWAQGRHEADIAARAERDQLLAAAQQLAAEHAAAAGRALEALVSAAGGLERRALPLAAELEDAVVRTAFALVEAILGRELAVAASPGRDALARVLALAPSGRPVVVRLNPADHAMLTDDGAPAAVAHEFGGRAVTLVADPSLRSGDAVADCDATEIDGRLDTALTRAKEVLGL